MTKIAVFGQGPAQWEDPARLSALGVRSWHFASALARAGHDVLLFLLMNDGSTPQQGKRRDADGVRVWWFSEHACHERPELIERQLAVFGPECIVGVNRDPAAIAVNFAGDLPLWADVNGDPMAEAQSKAARGGGDFLINEWYRKLVPVLLRADRLSACSHAQRHALIGQLGMVGRLVARNEGYEFVSAIPNAIADEQLEALERIERRQRRPKDPFVLLWSGGFNTWCDPELLYQALELAMVEAEPLRFLATGGALPGHHTEAYARFEARVAASPFRDRFQLKGWVSNDELRAHYAAADAGIFVDRACYEGVLGARTRVLEWLAAGLPVVCTRQSEISFELEAAGIAVTAPCGDALQLRDAIRRLMNDPAGALQRGRLARQYARERCRTELQLEPLLDWVRGPERAPALEARVELSWQPSAAHALRTRASLLVSHWNERGPTATLTSVGKFAARRLLNRASRATERWAGAEPRALKSPK